MTFTVDGTNGLTFPDTTVQTTAGVPTFRNRLINGDMRVDQRNAGAAQTITAAAALAYTVDRWYAWCTGANVTGARVAGATNQQNNYQFTGAASVTAISFAQRIEQNNSYDMAGTTATLSVSLSNSLLTTVTWTAYYANTADTFGTIASPTVTSIATGSFTVNSTLSTYTTNIAIPAAATTGLQIVFSVGAQISGTWVIGKAQLEVGSVATPFERLDYGRQLAQCQRYCPSYNGVGGSNIGTGAAFNATGAFVVMPLQVTPRVFPTGVTVTTPTGFSVSNATGGTIALTALAISVGGYTSVRMSATVASGLTAGNACAFYEGNVACLLIFTGCEL